MYVKPEASLLGEALESSDFEDHS